jgi:DNA-binding HxlR family transcriptional regulator
MQRDMDLVREILGTVEAADAEELRHCWLEMPGYTQSVVAQHVEIMQEAGLVEAHVLAFDGVPPQAARVFRLTWAGHDFLAAVRNDTVWAKSKQLLKEKGGALTFDMLKAVAVQFGKQHLGLPLE